MISTRDVLAVLFRWLFFNFGYVFNVAISRAKEKLIILGNFDMMLNGWTSSSARYRYKSPARSLARLVDSRYGKVIDAPRILVQ